MSNDLDQWEEDFERIQNIIDKEKQMNDDIEYELSICIDSISGLNNEPLDGDVTQEIAEKFLEMLNERYANV